MNNEEMQAHLAMQFSLECAKGDVLPMLVALYGREGTFRAWAIGYMNGQISGLDKARKIHEEIKAKL